MIDVISVENMRLSDQRTIESGTPGTVLMKRAATGIYLASDRWQPAHRITIVTGSGNNGGDGFALAVILHENGISSRILTLSDRTTPDAGFYKEKCVELGIELLPFSPSLLSGSDLIADCILGTGFAGVPRDNVRCAIEEINSLRQNGSYVISADINSGMNGDTGEFSCAVNSDLTVAIGSLKKGQITDSALSITGSIKVAEIGIPPVFKEDEIDTSEYGIEVIDLSDR